MLRVNNPVNPPGRKCFLIQRVARRPTRQLVAVRCLRLAQHIRRVRFHRLHRDKELRRNLLIRVATRQQPQHFKFPARELIRNLPLPCLLYTSDAADDSTEV